MGQIGQFEIMSNMFLNTDFSNYHIAIIYEMFIWFRLEVNNPLEREVGVK